MRVLTTRNTTFFLVLLFMTSMIYSKFLLSVSMFGLGAMAVFDFSNNMKLRDDFLSGVKLFFRTPVFVALALTVLAYLISGVNSSDLGEWFWRVRTKSPFLFLPMIFFLLPMWPKVWYSHFMAFFAAMASLSAILVMANYFINQQEMLELLYVGKPIPTPCHHVRYSLILAIAALIALHGIFSVSFKWRKWMPVVLLILAAAVHVLAVRTGLVMFYFGIAILSAYHLVLQRKWILLIAAMAGTAIIAVLATEYVPSLKQKLDYARYDLEQYKKGEGQTYSDSERIISIQTGWQLFLENPMAGVGIGDLRQEMTSAYERTEVISRKKFPHNQLVFVLAGCGLLGAILFFGGLLYPLAMSRPPEMVLYRVIYLLLLMSMVVENTIETQVGTAIVIFWICIFLKWEKDQALGKWSSTS